MARHKRTAAEQGAWLVVDAARLTRMQYQPGLIEGFLTGTRLDLTPLCNPRN